ncbi:MAG: hypothetical protein ACK4ZJ_17430, partial [Allorhizobium sp.]
MVTVVLQAVRGDPDLYLSATNPRPMLTSADWISADLGSDVISLTSDHPDWPRHSNRLHIGVYGREGADYVLRVQV